jgi:cation diffusion facilitator CzcD-associated flavoprotein CzcO
VTQICVIGQGFCGIAAYRRILRELVRLEYMLDTLHDAVARYLRCIAPPEYEEPARLQLPEYRKP